MPDVQNPVAQPLGGPTISGTTITVDVLTNPPTRIPQQIRDLVASNQGYFAERVFATPGFTIQGGAIIYTETFPEDLFLDPTAGIGPRAPGAEAPRIGSLRRPPKVARPESWAGSIEVTDEARRRNDVLAVSQQFVKAANSFADRIQHSALTTLVNAISSWGRQAVGAPWRLAHTTGIWQADPATLPQRDFSLVRKQFIKDKAGVVPDTLIVNPEDGFYLDLIYGDRLQPLLDRYGLTMFESVLVTEGQPIFLKSKQVGVLAFEKPLDQEYTREGTRKTDVYTLESTPVPVAIDASAVLQLTGVNSAS